MSLFTQDVFAEAKALGLTEGFVGSFSDLHQLLLEATAEVQPDEDGDLAYQRHLENQGWYAAQAQEAYEASFGFPALDAFEPVAPIEQVGFIINGVKVVKPDFNAENDPDGEAENAWHEQLGEQWAEGRASAWFDFPGDRGNVPMAFA